MACTLSAPCSVVRNQGVTEMSVYCVSRSGSDCRYRYLNAQLMSSRSCCVGGSGVVLCGLKWRREGCLVRELSFVSMRCVHESNGDLPMPKENTTMGMIHWLA